MPRVKRRGHNRRGLTVTQHEILTYGYTLIGDDPGFESEAAERAAWMQNRETLMAEFAAHHPGERPAGWWTFDAGMDPPTLWWKQAEELERRGLLDADEQFRIEQRHRILAGDQGADLFGLHTIRPQYETCTYNRDAWERDRPGHIRDDIRLSEFAAGWHSRRRRVELAAKYSQRVDALTKLLTEIESKG